MHKKRTSIIKKFYLLFDINRYKRSISSINKHNSNTQNTPFHLQKTQSKPKHLSKTDIQQNITFNFSHKPIENHSTSTHFELARLAKQADIKFSFWKHTETINCGYRKTFRTVKFSFVAVALFICTGVCGRCVRTRKIWKSVFPPADRLSRPNLAFAQRLSASFQMSFILLG